MVVPAKPFASYKWRWLSDTPSEGLLDSAVFLGVLRSMYTHEGRQPSDLGLINSLSNVALATGTRVNLARTPERNLVRNSGQYWKGTGLLQPGVGIIELTPFGRDVASGAVTQSEFVAMMIAQTTLPNPVTFPPAELQKWSNAGLVIHPLRLILEVLEALRPSAVLNQPHLTCDELVRVVVPLAGVRAAPLAIARHIRAFRGDAAHCAGWPNCAPAANDRRMARELLLFLANFNVLHRTGEGGRDHEQFVLTQAFDSVGMVVPEANSLLEQPDNSAQIMDQLRQSQLPTFVERQRTLVSTLARPLQRQFRSRVLEAFGGQCFLTGERMTDVLEAAHIIPVTHRGDDSIGNGLALRIDIHRLFDAGHIRLTPTGQVHRSQLLQQSANYVALPQQIVIPNFVSIANVRWRNDYQ
jgi:HNH endonuclease